MDWEALRNRLMSVAGECAEGLRKRPNVVGLVLYGSLARGGLTRFSDVDIAVILDGELPEVMSEHRVVRGVKVDFTPASLSDMRNLLTQTPTSLYRTGSRWTFPYVVESLLLGGMESVLHDPTGEICHIKEELNRRTTYRQLTLEPSRKWIRQMADEPLPAMAKGLEEGDYAKAASVAVQTAYGCSHILGFLTAIKDLDAAAEALGIPGFCAAFQPAKEVGALPGGVVEEAWQEGKALWDYTLRQAYEPILDALRQSGVREPEALELVGDYNLFWDGYRIHELGRVIAEVNLSLDWSRHHLDNGRTREARDVLWGCGDFKTVKKRWTNLQTALKETGCDVRGIVGAMVEDEEFRRLGERFDAAVQRVQASREVSREDAKRVVASAQACHALLEEVLSRME